MRVLILLTGLSLSVPGGLKLLAHHHAVTHPDAFERALQMRCFSGAVAPSNIWAQTLHCWGCPAFLTGVLLLTAWVLMARVTKGRSRVQSVRAENPICSF